MKEGRLEATQIIFALPESKDAKHALLQVFERFAGLYEFLKIQPNAHRQQERTLEERFFVDRFAIEDALDVVRGVRKPPDAAGWKFWSLYRYQPRRGMAWASFEADGLADKVFLKIRCGGTYDQDDEPPEWIRLQSIAPLTSLQSFWDQLWAAAAYDVWATIRGEQVSVCVTFVR
jgi:hypothetical protein